MNYFLIFFNFAALYVQLVVWIYVMWQSTQKMRNFFANNTTRKSFSQDVNFVMNTSQR